MAGIALSTILVFSSVLVISFSLLVSLRQGRERRRLLNIKSAQGSSLESFPEEDEAGILFAEDSPIIGRLSSITRARGQENPERGKRLHELLVRAGYRKKGAVTIYTSLRLVVLVALPITFVSAALMSEISQGWLGVGSVCTILAGYLFPDAFLTNRMKRRRAAVDRHLPSAIDLLAVCVDAGMGLSQALTRVGRVIQGLCPVLSGELTLVSLQTSAGKPNADAMRELAWRVDSRDLSMLVNTLIQTERFGTSVSEALRNHSGDMRIYRLQAAEERAGKATILMLIPTALIMLSILIIILGLGAIQAWTVLG